ncbi:MAG: nuclear transport factor 2 family protein [Leptolyngbyaceae cyanobacterium]
MIPVVKIALPVTGWGVALSLMTAGSAGAATPATAPAELTTTLAAIEAAANAQDIDQLMAFYSEDFVGPDGFTREQYQTTLSAFWEQYSTLTYEVELNEWDTDGGALIADTVTTVEGTKLIAGRPVSLMAELRSRQRYENGQLVSQEIIAEQNRLISGERPPEITVQLPTVVTPGSEFNFDAIVEEPLGDRLLLGLAFEEGVTAEDFLTPRPVDLEALSAGGLFKVGKAPQKPDQRWISAVLVREDGIVIDTRRLTVGID